MSGVTQTALPWHRREDTWAIFIALGLVLTASVAFFLGASRLVSTTALTIPAWSDVPHVVSALRSNPVAPIALFAVFLGAISIA